MVCAETVTMSASLPPRSRSFEKTNAADGSDFSTLRRQNSARTYDGLQIVHDFRSVKRFASTGGYGSWIRFGNIP